MFIHGQDQAGVAILEHHPVLLDCFHRVRADRVADPHDLVVDNCRASARPHHDGVQLRAAVLCLVGLLVPGTVGIRIRCGSKKVA